MLPPAPAHPRRLVYLGTPAAAVPPLEALVDAGFDIALVVSRPDRRRGRRAAPTPSPVKARALELGLPVTDELERATEVGADLGVVVAYGRLVPVTVLERLPMVNLHFSLLPRWRGAAPVERAVLAGDEQTGVCLMRVEEGLDAGGVYDSVTLDIQPDETVEALRARLVEAGTELLVRRLREGLGTPVPQQGEPTYADKLDPAELELRWDEPAELLARKVRVGGAYTTFRGRRLKVWAANAHPEVPGPPPGVLDGLVVGTGRGVLELVEVQPEGRARLAARAWANGARPAPGERLGG